MSAEYEDVDMLKEDINDLAATGCDGGIVRKAGAEAVLAAATRDYPKLPVFDIRKRRLWALRNSLHVDWETVRLGKLYSILPPRGERMLVAGGCLEVANGLLHDCMERLKESGYVLHAAIELPEAQPPNWPRAASLDEDLGPKLLLWKPSPVISECFPVILQTLEAQEQHSSAEDLTRKPSETDALYQSLDIQREANPLASNSMTMLDLAAGSGRDVVWPLTSTSPLCRQIRCVVALEQSHAANLRGEALATSCDIDARQETAANIADGHGSNIADAACGTGSPPQGAIFVLGDAKNVAHVRAAAACAHTTQFSIVHVARFLDRRLFPTIRDTITPGGFVLYHHFLVGSFRPKGEGKLLRHGELATAFGPDFGFDVLVDRVIQLADTRPVSIFCAQKKAIVPVATTAPTV
eukprot:m.80765 g.80765  ORF g.80765 m.80765 type:complete len:410 (-) comp16314_c0_seq1:261-1490(-)